MKLAIVGSMLIIAILIGWVGSLPFAWREAANSSVPPLPIIDFLAGMTLGLTMAHFVVDVDIWRFSPNEQRESVREKFAFLFASSASSISQSSGEARHAGV